MVHLVILINFLPFGLSIVIGSVLVYWHAFCILHIDRSSCSTLVCTVPKNVFGNDLVYSFFLNLKLRVLAISTCLACISQYASNCGYTFLFIYAFSSFKEKLLRGRQIMRLEEKFLSQVKRGLEIFARKNV